MKNQQNYNKCYRNVKELNNENKIGISAEALECKICFDIFDKIPGLLRCGHSFCYKCINLIRAQAAFFKKSDSFKCPLCTKAVPVSDFIIPNYAFDEVLQYASKANENIVVPQYINESKLLKTLEIQKQLYSEACKILENSEKEKLLLKNEKECLLKKVREKDDVIQYLFLAALLFFGLMVFVIKFCTEQTKKRNYY